MVAKKPKSVASAESQPSAEIDPAFAPIARAFADDPSVRRGKMFSSPSVLAVDGKIFAMLVAGKLVVKLPRARADALVDARIGSRFDPRKNGQPMKEWIAISSAKEPWIALAKEAHQFVRSVAKKKAALQDSSRFRFVALLRGINVGGKNLLPMRTLVTMFEKAGATDVATYIQSGNVVFTAPPDLAERLPQLIGDAIARQLGLRVPVVIRSRKEMRAIAVGNPFLATGVDPNRLHVIFLADRPSAKLAKILDPNRSPGDSFELRGGEIFLSITSAAKTRISNAYLDATLQTVSTGRNWRTVSKLLEMLEMTDT